MLMSLVAVAVVPSPCLRTRPRSKVLLTAEKGVPRLARDRDHGHRNSADRDRRRPDPDPVHALRHRRRPARRRRLAPASLAVAAVASVSIKASMRARMLDLWRKRLLLRELADSSLGRETGARDRAHGPDHLGGHQQEDVDLDRRCHLPTAEEVTLR